MLVFYSLCHAGTCGIILNFCGSDSLLKKKRLLNQRTLVVNTFLEFPLKLMTVMASLFLARIPLLEHSCGLSVLWLWGILKHCPAQLLVESRKNSEYHLPTFHYASLPLFLVVCSLLNVWKSSMIAEKGASRQLILCVCFLITSVILPWVWSYAETLSIPYVCNLINQNMKNIQQKIPESSI